MAELFAKSVFIPILRQTAKDIVLDGLDDTSNCVFRPLTYSSDDETTRFHLK